MSNLKQEELLRHAISDILLLEYGGGGYGGEGGDGYGVSEEFFTDIFNAFIDPFRHSAAFIENFSSEIQKMAGHLAEDVMAIYLPGYRADHEQHEEEYKERMDAITDKYSEVFARTEAHLFTGDAALMGFLYSPHAFITGKLLKKTPDAALAMVDMFAGGNPAIKSMTDRARETTGRISHYGRMRGGPTSDSPMAIDVGGKKGVAEPTMKPMRWWNPRKEPKTKDPSKQFYGKTHTESIRRDEEMLNEAFGDFFKKLIGAFQKPEIQQAIENSPMAKQMKQDAESYVAEYVKGIIKMTSKSIKGLRSTSALDRATGGKFTQLIDRKGKDDAKKTAQLVVGGTKSGIKDIAIKGLKEKMGKLPKSAAPLSKIYQQGIKQIKSL